MRSWVRTVSGGDGVFSLLLNYPLVESYYYVSLLCLMGLELAFWVLIGYGHFMGLGLLEILEGLYPNHLVVPLHPPRTPPSQQFNQFNMSTQYILRIMCE